MWYICAMEAIRKDEMLPFVTTWMDLKNIILSEISQTEKVKNHDFLHMWDLKQMNKQEKQSYRHRQQCGSYQGEGGEEVVKGKEDQIFGHRRWFDFGWWAHNAIYR